MSKPISSAGAGVDGANIAQGIVLMLFAGLAFSLSFAFIKELGPEMPIPEIMLFRMGVGLVPMLPLLLRAPKGILKTDRPFGHVYRVSVGFTSMALLYWALPRMPLVDLTTTQFTMPLFLTVLSVPLLREAVGWRRAIATLVGFGGVLIMLNPKETGFGGLDVVYLVALGSAFFYALAAIAIRQLGATEPALRTTIYFSSVAAIAGGIGCLFDWVDPTMKELALLVGTGLVGGVGQFALVSAYKKAPATIVAPFDYSQLLWATILGFVFWQETPAQSALIGAAILAAAGIYIFRREATTRARR